MKVTSLKFISVRYTVKPSLMVWVSLSFCAGGQWGFSAGHFLVFLMKESKKRRRKQPGKLMAKSRSQFVNLSGGQPLMNPLLMAT